MTTPHGYGRTRRPKALWDDSTVSSKQVGTSITMLTDAANLSAALTSVVAGQKGYSTENQRFLHLQIECDDTTESVTVYVYNYAFGAWSPLYLTVLSTSINGSKAIGTFNSINGKKLLVLPIEGVDRVAFVSTSAIQEAFVVRAACTSF